MDDIACFRGLGQPAVQHAAGQVEGELFVDIQGAAFRRAGDPPVVAGVVAQPDARVFAGIEVDGLLQRLPLGDQRRYDGHVAPGHAEAPAIDGHGFALAHGIEHVARQVALLRGDGNGDRLARDGPRLVRGRLAVVDRRDGHGVATADRGLAVHQAHGIGRVVADEEFLGIVGIRIGAVPRAAFAVAGGERAGRLHRHADVGRIGQRAGDGDGFVCGQIDIVVRGAFARAPLVAADGRAAGQVEAAAALEVHAAAKFVRGVSADRAAGQGEAAATDDHAAATIRGVPADRAAGHGEAAAEDAHAAAICRGVPADRAAGHGEAAAATDVHAAAIVPADRAAGQGEAAAADVHAAAG